LPRQLSSPLPGRVSKQQPSGEQEQKNYEAIDSAQKSDSSNLCRDSAQLCWFFIGSARSSSAAGRRLSQLHHRGAMFNNVTGSNNTAIGDVALHNSHTSGNIGLGFQAGLNVTNASNIICIGNVGADVSDSCFIGNIRGVATHMADAILVVIDSIGQLGTQSSSHRFKKDIKPMDGTSNSILELKPVTFRYNGDIKDTPQFGLIAEEVADVNPDLVVRDKNGEIYTVRYEAVNAMLLNEFLKEHRKVEQQETRIAQLKQEMETVVARFKEQAAKIETVKAQIEGNITPLRVVASKP